MPDINKSTYESPDVVKRFIREDLWPAEVQAFKYFEAPGKILDLGCGTGRTTVHLVKKGLEVEAVDYSEGMIYAAKENHPEIADVFHVADATNLSQYPSNYFYYALFSCNGLDYLYPPYRRIDALREIRRVLKPKGVFIFSSHNSVYIPSRRYKAARLLRTLLRGRIYPYRIDFQPYGELLTYYISPPSQKWQLEKVGFTYIKLLSVSSRHPLKAAFVDPHPLYICKK